MAILNLMGQGYLNTGTVAVTTGAIGATTVVDATVTIAGAAAGDAVVMNPPIGFNAGLVVGPAWVSAANTVTIRIFNQTGGSITPTAASAWTYLLLRP